MDAERFAFAFDPTYRRLSRPFGVTPESAWMEVGGGLFKARVPGLEPLRLIKHPELTVTVEDYDRLAALLTSGDR
jgi:hypothetical protein